MLTVDQLRKKYLDFFVKKHHKLIPPDSLIQMDSVATSLFTVAGMQQLIPYLKGKNIRWEIDLSIFNHVSGLRT